MVGGRHGWCRVAASGRDNPLPLPPVPGMQQDLSDQPGQQTCRVEPSSASWVELSVAEVVCGSTTVNLLQGEGVGGSVLGGRN